MSSSSPQNPLKTPRITALTPAQAARILTAAGSRRITEEMIRADIEAGAPTNPDGTVNLIYYAAWLNKRLVTTEPACQGEARRSPEAKTDGD